MSSNKKDLVLPIISLAALGVSAFFAYKYFETQKDKKDIDERLKQMEKEKEDLKNEREKINHKIEHLLSKENNREIEGQKNVITSQQTEQELKFKQEKLETENNQNQLIIEQLKKELKNERERGHPQYSNSTEQQDYINGQENEINRLRYGLVHISPANNFTGCDSLNQSGQQLNRNVVLNLLRQIRKMSQSRIIELNSKYKKKRRENMENEEKYREINDKLTKGIQQILTECTMITLQEHEINQIMFDESIVAITNDEEIEAAVHNLATPDVTEQPPENLTGEKVEEILNYYQNLNKEVLNNTANLENQDYDQFNAKIEDTVYKTYGVEVVQIAAWYMQPGHEELNETLIGALKSSTSKILSLNKSLTQS